jgi:rubredoxin
VRARFACPSCGTVYEVRVPDPYGSRADVPPEERYRRVYCSACLHERDEFVALHSVEPPA